MKGVFFMKKIIVLVLALVLFISSVGCNGSAPKSPEEFIRHEMGIFNTDNETEGGITDILAEEVERFK
jgi:hypothetical protein